MPGPKQMTGRTIGNWILEAALSEGGMGAVYRARHVNLAKQAAVKVMRPEFTDEQSFRERFRREAATQARLEHPNIARVHDYMEQDGCWFLVMELVEGGSLADELVRRSGPIPVDQALAWIREALEGLGYAHSEGVIHRDVKPMNLLLNRHGQVVVADFGIAKEEALPQLTNTGHTVGTPQYMSPEQVQRPGEVDHRSDLYSVGVVLYELLTGRRPFDGDSGFQVALAHVQTPPPAMIQINPSLPTPVIQVVERAMAKDPAGRYQSAAEFVAALDAAEAGVQTPPPVTATVVTPPPPPTTVMTTPPPQPQPTQTQPTQTQQPSRTVRMDSAAFGTPPPPSHPPAPTSKSGPKLWMAAAAAAAVFAVAVAAGVIPFGSGAEAQTLEDVVRHAREAGEKAAEAETHADLAADLAEKAYSAAEDAARESDLTEKSTHFAGGRAALREAETALERAERAEAEALDSASKARAVAEALDLDLGGTLPSVDSAPSTVPRSGSPEATDTGRRAVASAGQSAREAQADVRSARQAFDRADRRLKEVEADLPNPAQAEAEALERIEREKTDAQQRIEEKKREAEEELQKKKREFEDEVARKKAEAERKRRELEAKLNPDGGPLPDQPVVAVLGTGDPLFVGPFEMELERRLLRANLDVRSEHNSLELGEQLDGVRQPSPKELGEILREQGFHVLVLVSLDEGARKSQVFRRVQGNAVAGRLRINAYLLNTSRSIGRGWSEAVEYTDGSAAAKAERSLIGATPELAESIRSEWRSFKKTYAELSQ